MKSTLSIKWSCENNAAYDLLDRTYELLDKRKAAILSHLNNMGLSAILAHKVATGLKGGAHNIAQASAGEALA